MTDPWGDPDPNRTWRPDAEPAADALYSYFAPPGAEAPQWEPEPPEPLSEWVWQQAVTFATTTAAVVLLGAPLALLWRALATPAVVLRTAAGPQPAAPESSQVFAVEGRFVVASVLAGLVAGAVAWLLLRDRGPAGPVALAAGGFCAAAVAAAVGRRFVVDRYLYDFCQRLDVDCPAYYDGTLRLNVGFPAFFVLPAVMLTAFALLSLAFDRGRD